MRPYLRRHFFIGDDGLKAIMFIHGLSAKKEDNEYFINKMNSYSNIKVFTFTLPGHENDKVSKSTGKEWLDKSEEELKKILKKYKKVTIVAHSMGTIIAVNLAARYKEIDKLVLISSAFKFGNFKQNKEDIKNIITKKVNQDIGTGFEGAIKKIFTIPKSVMFEYIKSAENNKENIKKITCPTLLLHGDIDNVISVDSSKFVYDNLTCPKELVIIEGVRHQVFKSSKKEKITKYIYNFITFNLLYKLSRKKKI